MKTKYPLRWDLSESTSTTSCKSELHLQSMLVQWFYTSYPEFRICTITGIRTSAQQKKQDEQKTEPLRTLLFHNLNNPKSVVEGAKLSSCGVVKGRQDMTLYVPRGQYHGLCIELKDLGERLKPEQIEVAEMLIKQGYCYEWVDNLNDAKQLIIDYLAL